MTATELTDLLAPLTEAATRGRYLRLLVRPGWAAADRPEGEIMGLDVAWTPEAHAQALAATQQPVRLSSGAVVSGVGDTLVLKLPPDTVWRAEDLSREGWLSPMAARLLTAALGLGRNILVTGPWALASQIMATLVNEGRRPALLGSDDEALPRRWLHARDIAQAQAVGADRVVLLSHAPGQVAQAMGQLSGVAAWLDAWRLDRALMRFELGAEAISGRGNAPLHVLAGLDLVVVVSQQGGPRVVQIAEIVLTEQGYRPGLLFLTGLPPAPTALVPVAVPSFLDELAAAGHTVLVEELRQIAPPAPALEASDLSAVGSPAAPPQRATPGAPPVQRARSPEERQAVRPHRLVIEPPAADHAEPGWELDRLGEAPSVGAAAAATPGTAEDAAMAAAYGLGPPPAPGARGNFAQVLRQERETDDEGPGQDGGEAAGDENRRDVLDKDDA